MADAPVPGCTGGFGAEKLMRRLQACATCGYPAVGPGGVEHCYLYERCERCGSDTDPCGVAVAIREELQRAARRPRPDPRRDGYVVGGFPHDPTPEQLEQIRNGEWKLPQPDGSLKSINDILAERRDQGD